MIGNIALTLYISFVFGFTAFYIFVGHSEWNWTKKIIGMIVATLLYALILPLICGIYMGVKYVKELKDNK